jgi:hypothetical protein
MGSASGFICKSCGARFTVSSGGGFYFDLLHCDTCGANRMVGHQDQGDIHLRFVKGLAGPYAVARAATDRKIQQEYPGEPIGRDEYHLLAESTLEPCACGGHFRYDAPPRCPDCRSLREEWDRDPTASGMMYD